MHRGARDPWLDKRSAIGSVVRVTKEYRPWTPEQAFFLPPSPLDWLPEGHLAYFVLELVRELDVSAIEHALQSKEARGVRPYSPRMMTALLIYGYCTGVFSSRKIERATYRDVAFRVVAYCEAHSVDAYIAVGRQDDDGALGRLPMSAAQEVRWRMHQKITSAHRRAIYACRKVIVEPVFGQIKASDRLLPILVARAQ